MRRRRHRLPPGYLSMGDVATEELSEEEWRRRMLRSQESVRDWQQKWVEQDRRARMLQIAATLAIPLAGAVWRLILGRKTVPPVG